MLLTTRLYMAWIVSAASLWYICRELDRVIYRHTNLKIAYHSTQDRFQPISQSDSRIAPG